MLCLLALACADEINRIQSTVDADAVVFGHYELGEVATEPGDMPAQSEDVTLRDVKFINKISATESLFVTEKNVTWKYDEEANTLTKITYSGDKTYESSDFVQSGTTEYGFSKHLLRMYVKASKAAHLVVTPSMTGTGGYSKPVLLEASLYDANKPPLMLYLDAETEDRNVPSVLMFTKGKYVLNSFAMTCEDKGPISVQIGAGDKYNLSDTKKGVGGIGSDGRSFWILTDNDFSLLMWYGCTQLAEKDASGKEVKDSQGNVSKKASHDYKHFSFKFTNRKLSVSYRGENASRLPLGIWIDVSNNKRPVIGGKIISISTEGKLLSAAVPSEPE